MHLKNIWVGSTRPEPPSIDSKSNVQKYISNIKNEKKFRHTLHSYHGVETPASYHTESKRSASGNCHDFLEAVFEIWRSQIFFCVFPSKSCLYSSKTVKSHRKSPLLYSLYVLLLFSINFRRFSITKGNVLLVVYSVLALGIIVLNSSE